MRRISIITSVFRNGDQLVPFLQDISRQTIFGDCWLFLLNCAPVAEAEDHRICQDFAQANKNVVYVRLDPDPGIYGAWNWACENSASPYFTNANVDDRLHPQSLEKHAALLDKKAEVSVVYSHNLCTHVPNETWETTQAKNRYPSGPFNPLVMLRQNLPHNHPMWRRELHEKYGFFDNSLKSAADYDFWLRCTAGGEKFELIPENLGLYYFNPQGMSTNKANQGWKLREEARVRTRHQKNIMQMVKNGT